MGFKLRRRSVYVGTVVALIAMIGGLALASITLNSTLLSSTQGSTSTSLTATAWTPGTVTEGNVGTATCGTTVAITNAVPASAYVAGTSGACGVGHITETITYTATVPVGVAATVLSDTFTLYSSACSGAACAPASTVSSITITVTENGATTYTANLSFVIDYGSVAGPVTISSISVSINGAF